MKKIIIMILIFLGVLYAPVTVEGATNDDQLVIFENMLPSKLKQEIPKISEIKIMYGNDFYNKLESFGIFNECVGNTIYNTQTKDMYVYVQYDCDVNKEYATFVHEMFHALDNTNDITSSDEWIDTYMDEKGFFEDPYFNNSSKEFFAEAGAWYVSSSETKEKLRVSCPETYNFIEKVLLR